MFSRVSAVIGVAFLLAGCGGVGSNATELPPLTVVPPPTPYVEGRCEVISVFEPWLQTVDNRRHDFQTIVNDLDGKSRGAVYAETERLSRIAITTSREPAPDCAEAAHNMLLNVMNTTLAGLQAYVNNDRDDLDVIISSAQRGFDSANAEFGLLTDQLAGQFEERIQQQTQASP